ncbi:MAG: TrkA C-terminal domain-containing protein, partial [Clostridia bacterium]|nr:TrkA C-terminal domain-containing protein [Clostridia bacterium]
EGWFNKSLAELDVRRKFKLNIVAVRHEEELNTIPGPETTFYKGDTMLIIARTKDVYKLGR